MKLLEEIKVGKSSLKNRVVFPPLTTGYEERDGSIGPKSFSFYTRLAQGGVGYIVLGDVAPIATFSPTPRLYDDSQIPSFKALADSVHKYGSKLAIQIFHPEYDAEGLFVLFRQGKVDEMRAKLHYDMLHWVNEASSETLDGVIAKIVACAKRAEKAGVDAIQIHGDRLVGSLCSPIINKRTDEYGGSFENRIRFALKLTKALREAVPDMILDYKLPIITPDGDGLRGKGGLEIDEAIKLAKLVETEGVDMIHVGQANHTGNMNDTIPAMGTREYAFMVEETKAIKEAVKVPVCVVGRVFTPEAGEALINAGVADLVAYGRPLLSDADFVLKTERGESQCIRHCISCNAGCTDAIMQRRFISCVLNAENGYEGERSIKKTSSPKKVAVIGGGIAGLEAARVLIEKGHDATIFEKSNRLGGQINIACMPPRKDEMKRALNYYENVLKGPNCHIILGHEPSFDELNAFDHVLVAIGAHNIRPRIEGIDLPNVVSAWDVLDGKVIPYGRIAVCGGGLVGSETAEYLANKGYKVTIIEMLDKVAKQESSTILPSVMKDFADHGVVIKTLTKISSFALDGVHCITLDAEGKEVGPDFIKAETIVTALTAQKNEIDLTGLKVPYEFIGDCLDRPSNIDHAVKSAYLAANAIE